MESFEEYKAGKGSVLSQNYEEAKRTAKEAKLRYRHVISLVNGHKSKIDEIQDVITKTDEGSHDAKLLAALDEAKRGYREIFEEMQLCKEQVKEMQTLKQRTMSTLINSFQQYQAAIVST